MFRVRFVDGGELQLTEAGSKKRAGVWLLRPDALRRPSSRTSGPRPTSSTTEDVARHPRLGLAAAALAAARPAADRRHRPRVGERDPLGRAALAVPALDARSMARRLERLAAAIRDELDARPRAAARRRERREDLPRAQQARPAVRALRHADRARRLRGAHDLLLPAVPDRRPRAQGSAAVEAAQVKVERVTEATRRARRGVRAARAAALARTRRPPTHRASSTESRRAPGTNCSSRATTTRSSGR